MASLPPPEPYDPAPADPDDHAIPEPFPWPPAPDRSLLDAFAATWRRATFAPRPFFVAMPRTTGYGAALLYYLAIGTAAAGIELFWRSFGAPFSASDPGLLRRLGLPFAEQAPLLGFLFSPILLLVMIVLAAGVTHAVLAVLGGANAGFRTTARVFAFSYSPQLFVIVPVVGPLIGSGWMIAIAMIGLRHAHDTDQWRAVLAVLLPLGFLFVFYVIALVAAMGSMIIG